MQIGRGILATLIISSTCTAASIGSDELSSLLATAKLSGMCGAIGQMAQFQESTDMPGGGEFVVRFLRTEAARLGWSVEEFQERCAVADEQYQLALKLVESSAP